MLKQAKNIPPSSPLQVFRFWSVKHQKYISYAVPQTAAAGFVKDNQIIAALKSTNPTP